MELVRNATLFDDLYMNVFFKDQPELVQFILRLILDKPDLIERGRYYLSKMDNDFLKQGEDYEKLSETYVIFVCRGDAVKTGNPLDDFVRRNAKGKELNDGHHLLFINADYDGQWSLKDLMADFKSPNPKQMRYNVLKERASYLKEKEEGLMYLTPEMEKFKANVIEEKLRKIICNALKKGRSPEAISDITDVPIDEIQKIEQEMKRSESFKKSAWDS